PLFSMQNNDLFFKSWRDGNMELFKSDSLLQNIQRLTWNKIDELHPWPSPNGQQLVFTEGDQAQNNTKIVIMDIDGSNRKYITNESNTFGAIPSFNYKGDKITYATWHIMDGKYTNPYIVVQHLQTDERTVITTDEFESWRPIFSPDERKLYYIAKDKNDQFDIYEYSLDSNKIKNLTQSDYDEWDPSISRDGKKMVYAARKNDNWDLILLDLENNTNTQLTNTKGNEWDPSFSPCGNYIYFAATYGLRNGVFRMTLHE
ncbi:MAG: DPP IV N-terminal domain-containing protein, partial [Gelidibacter sp.]